MEGQSSLRKQAKFSRRILCSTRRILRSLMPNERLGAVNRKHHLPFLKDRSVYQQPIRTNNDIEAWHNTLNRRTGGQCRLQFYLLIELRIVTSL